MIPRRLLAALIVAALLLPIVITVVVGLARLLAAMNDHSGATMLERVALGCGVLWIVDVVTLVIAQAANSLGPPREPPVHEQ